MNSRSNTHPVSNKKNTLASIGDCYIYSLNRIPYQEALKLQLEMHSKCAEKVIPGILLLLEHDPVITMGVGYSPNNILASQEMLKLQGIELVKTDRGGDVTYHGPGQLVGYPIVRLRELGGDLHGYLRLLEQSIIDTLAEFGLTAGRNGPAGVWVGNKKICSIGVAVRKWVAYHGFALNVNPNMSHFNFINPCGLLSGQITSLAEQLSSPPSMNEVKEVYARCFEKTFNLKLNTWNDNC